MIAGLDWTSLAWLAGALALGGAATGILAGLFGVGGGAIIVPVLFEVFGVMGVPETTAMPLAVGTSLAIIVPTSLRSVQSHRARGAVDVALLKSWAAPMVIGVLAGAAIARFAPPQVFQGAFILVAGLNAAKLLFGRASWRLGSDLPTGLPRRVSGAVIGLLSALMGVGGGAMATLVMTLYGRPIHQAVATSAGVGVFIALPGALGYVLAGWGRADLPPLSIGFVSLLGFAMLAPASLLTAPIGVRLAHALPRRRLEILFGLFLLAVSLRFAVAMAL